MARYFIHIHVFSLELLGEISAFVDYSTWTIIPYRLWDNFEERTRVHLSMILDGLCNPRSVVRGNVTGHSLAYVRERLNCRISIHSKHNTNTSPIEAIQNYQIRFIFNVLTK